MTRNDLRRQAEQRQARDFGYLSRLAGRPCEPISSYRDDWIAGWEDADRILRRQARIAPQSLR
jgi:hypothetical protein